MKVLIITNFFYPQNHIAAFRLTAFAKYFRRAEYDVTVVTESDRDRVADWNGCQVHYLKDPVISVSALDEHLKRNKRWSLRRVVVALELRLLLDSKYFWRIKARKRVERLLRRRKYDIVLSTYGHLSPHAIVLGMRRKGNGFYWIADMRDEMSTNPALRGKWARFLLAWYERRILNKADLVLSVSKPILDDFRSRCPHDRFLEIKNGYDYPQVHDVVFQPRFTMGYFGSFYFRNTPDNWFKAYSELIAEGRLPADSRIKIVGHCGSIQVPDAIKSNVEIHPRLAHDQAIEMSVRQTDVLVMTYPKGRKGVYTGKLFDYLATNKPILAICDPQDVIARLLAETKAGFAVDHADIPAIKAAIMKCYGMWKNREVLPRDWDKIRQYSREYQTGILLDYISKHGPEGR